jgi:hypothetical protein
MGLKSSPIGLAFACACCSTTNAMVVCSNDSSLYCYSLVSRLGHNNKDRRLFR